MNFNEKWEKITLGEICNITTGNTNSQDAVKDGDYPLFDRSKEIKRSNKYLFDNEAIIIPGEGKEFKPRYYSGKFDLHQRAYAIWSNSELLLNRFLYYIMVLKNEILKKRAVGSTVKSLRKGLFEELIIPVPPFNEQKKIANILSTFDKKIELNNQMNKTLEEIAQVIYKNWFIDFEPWQNEGLVDSELGKIPKGWEIRTFGDIFKFVKGKVPDQKFKEKKKDAYKYLTISTLTGKKITYAKPDKNSIITGKNDPIIVMDGSRSGKIFSGIKGILGSTLAKLKIKKDNLSKTLIYFLLKEHEEKFMKNTTGSAVPHADKKYILNQKVVLPKKKSILNKFNKVSESTILKINENKKENRVLETLRDNLIPKLMSGEIRVEPDDKEKVGG